MNKFKRINDFKKLIYFSIPSSASMALFLLLILAFAKQYSNTGPKITLIFFGVLTMILSIGTSVLAFLCYKKDLKQRIENTSQHSFLILDERKKVFINMIFFNILMYPLFMLIWQFLKSGYSEKELEDMKEMYLVNNAIEISDTKKLSKKLSDEKNRTLELFESKLLSQREAMTHILLTLKENKLLEEKEINQLINENAVDVIATRYNVKYLLQVQK